nr:sigma-70 family RNA polymerase sigma factor [Corallococcus exercitus]
MANREACAVSVDVEAYYRRFGPQVLRRCRFLLRDEEQAVDAMHDVFVQLLRYQAALKDAGPSSLLHQIATRVCLNRLRGAKRRPEDRDDELVLKIAASGDTEARTAARGLLDRLFGRVPASSRDIAVLHLVDGMTLEETAREVGLSVSGVRKRLRALSAVLQELEAA